MFKNLNIGTKLFLGFGILVALFGLIGFMSWTKLDLVKKQSSDLTSKYVPEVVVASDIERNALNARYGIKAFGLTGEEQYLTSGTAFLGETRKFLELAGKHATRHADLVKLAEDVPEALAALTEYEMLVDEVAGLKSTMGKALHEAGKAAGAYMEMCEDFLANQNEQMKREIAWEADQEVLNSRLEKISLVNGIIDSGNHTRINTFRAIAERDPKRFGASLDFLGKAAEQLERLKAVSSDPRRLEQMGKIREAGQIYAENIRLCRNGMTELQEKMAKLGELAQILAATTKDVMQGGVSETEKIAAFTAGQIETTLTFVMMIIGIAAIIGTLIAIVITRMITRPLKTVVSISERAGSGDLTPTRMDFNYDGNDELGKMADALAAMISAQRESMKGIITEARNTVESAQALSALSEETNASVEEVKSSVEQISSMSQANSAALQETNAGVQEVSTSASSSAQASTEGASASARTIQTAQRAVEQVNKVIGDIETVGGKSKDVEATIGDLARSVKAISGFVETITGIADQTNLLALNAAIEAARAGDAGRGFAVVADEVRKLAEESAKAANEVSDLIAALQNDAGKAISMTNETGSVMGTTVIEARDAQAQLSAGLSEIAKITDVMQNIAAGAQEQAAAAEQMAAGVDQVSTATVQVVEAIENIRTNSDETSKASEGVAEHAQALAGGAKRIQEHLERFRVEESNPSPELTGTSS